MQTQMRPLPRKPAVSATALLLVFFLPTQVALASSPPIDVVRLATLGRVWGAVKFAHPWLTHKPIDWDAALLSAIPDVESAKGADEYAAAVQRMLDALADGATHVRRSTPPPTEASLGHSSSFEWTADATLVVHPDEAATLANTMGGAEVLRVELLKARSVVFDLRTSTVEQGALVASIIDAVADALPWREIHAPAIRHLVHSGYRSQGGIDPPIYRTSMLTEVVRVLAPPKNATRRRYAFILGPNSSLPTIAIALQRAGDAVLLAQGDLNPDAYVPQQQIPLGEGWEVWMRTGEFADGSVVRPDAQLPKDQVADVGIRAAHALLRRPIRRHSAPPGLPSPVWRLEQKYDGSQYPARQLRLLALFRIWNIIDRFYAYRMSLAGDWDTALENFIPRFLDARDAREYALAVAELATHVPDGHTNVRGAELRAYFGVAPPPVIARMVEGAPIVTDVFDAVAAREAGVEVGDVVVEVDGEPANARIQRLSRYTAGSTSAGQLSKVMQRLLTGPEGSTLTMKLKGRGDVLKQVRLQRWKKYYQQFPKRSGNAVRILAGNIGYVDLDRLEPAGVDAMFDELHNTRTIIFDLRNYPHETVWDIAPRINTLGAKYGALFELPTVDATEIETKRVLSRQIIVPTTRQRYTGKIVTLIDERSISHAEHTGLFFEAASGCTFIGTPTAGANGDVTEMLIPGGMTMTFTGLEVRHADGRPLQRVGLVPRIEVKPTIAGVRAGRDEVLERAQRFVNEGR